MITSVDNKKISELIDVTSAAQMQYANFNQEQTDRVFRAAAIAANNARIELAVEACKETKMGVVEDKVIKNHYAAEFIYNKYRDTVTVGVYEEDFGLGYQKIYSPVGVIGAIIPVTNPTSTAIFKILLALKTRNGIIVSSHPSAKNCVKHTCEVMLTAAEKAGAPKNIIMFVDNASVQDTQDLMCACDLIIATGGGAMVHAAYSSGTPALGVGAGNCPAIIAASADLDMATSSIIQSNTFDNGVICATENAVVVEANVYDEVIKLFTEKNGYVVTQKSDLDKFRKKMFKTGGHLLNPELVGKYPSELAKITGITIPKNTQLILCAVKDATLKENLSFEKLSTYVALYKASDFNDALIISENLLKHGPGHTCSLFIDEITDQKKLDIWANRLNTGRMVVNMPSSMGAVGDLYNFYLNPSMTLGCGSWGGNSTSENIEPKNLLNTKSVIARRENMLWMRLPSRIYHKLGCLPFALQDLKEWGCKKAFIVTDPIINKLYGSKLTNILKELGVKFSIFDGIEPNPTVSNTLTGVKAMKAAEPDVVIAIGGGSSMDAAKMIWLLHDYPNAKFSDLAITFADIRKRIVKFPRTGRSSKLVCIPTTSGTGSEVTPFAVITDDKTHIKYPLADYSLTPDMAIIDPELTLTVPKSATNAPGLDAMSHLVEAYVSVLATSYTDPYCLQGIKILLEYLPRAYHYGTTDAEARIQTANAATQAGMAFANAFLGIIHSMSHKIGGKFGVIHGCANSILMPYVIRYNAATIIDGGKQTYFPQKRVVDAIQRYAKIAQFCDIKGKSDADLTNKLIAEIQKLSAKVEIPASFKEYFKKFNLNISENDFLNVADEMAKNAFNDQCTAANPRYPLICDLKEIYLDAYYGKKVKPL